MAEYMRPHWVAKIEAIRGAQMAGAISSRFSPEILLLLILNLSHIGAPDSPEARSGLLDNDVFRYAIE